jgi:pimeloyl-ACP methyl ester carboxylesterase
MATQILRNGIWARRIVVGLSLSFVAFAGMALLWQAGMDARDARLFPPPGERVEASGYRLHVQVHGVAGDRPTVILDAGGGSFSAQWAWIQPLVAQFTRVVSYDRPGLGWSDSAPRETDGFEIAADLRDALNTLGVEGPYVLVGHSFGSVMIRVFAQSYPDEVAGLVHVDPRYLWMEDVLGDAVTREGDRMTRLLPLAARFGVARLSNPAFSFVDGLPQRQRDEGLAFFAATRHLTAMAAEWPMSNRTVARLAAAGESLGARPNIVLSAGADDHYFQGERRARFTASQAAIAQLSEKGEQRLIEGADHYTIVTQEPHARTVVAAIREVVESARIP